MEIFQFNGDSIYVDFSPQLLTIDIFKKIVNRDKSKDKDLAKKEISFVYFFSDIRSDYMYITNEFERKDEIVKDLNLPKSWRMDNLITEAVEFYKKRSTTVNSALYESACISAIEISEYLKGTKRLLEERTDKGAAVTNINSITGALAKVPDIMRNLTAAHTELIKEQKITEGRTKGSKTFNMFEDGLDYDNE